MSKIKSTDTLKDVFIKMSDGNIGATIVLLDLFEKGKEIDPDSFMGELGPIISLDSHGIYGTAIHVFYSDICNKDIAKMIAVLRACQLGYFDPIILADACSPQDRLGREMVPVDELYNKVKEYLPNFNN